MNIDEAIIHAKDVFHKKNTSCSLSDKSCGREHLQLSEWLSELKDRRRELSEYKSILTLILSDMSTFFSVWKPEDNDNLKQYEASIILSYENLQKMKDSMEKSLGILKNE